MTAATIKPLFIEGFTGDDGDLICYELQLSLQNEDGSPMDITGATSSFKAKRSYSDSNVAITVTEADGIIVDDTNSILTLQLKVSHFENVALNRQETEFVYDWDMVLDQRKYRLLRGVLTIGGDI